MVAYKESANVLPVEKRVFVSHCQYMVQKTHRLLKKKLTDWDCSITTKPVETISVKSLPCKLFD